MSPRFAAFVVLVFAALVAVFFLVIRKPKTSDPISLPISQVPMEEAKSESLLVPPGVEEIQVVESDTSEERRALDAAVVVPGRDPVLAELKGRIVLPDGAPAAGADLFVRGWGANQDRENLYGTPLHWEDLASETREDGSFSIAFDPPRAFQFTLDAALPDYSEVSWRWGEILPGEVKDLGTIVLQCGGTIVARIVDGSGDALTKGWSVYADGALSYAGDGRDQTRVIAHVPRSDGSFVLENLPPGRVRLNAHSTMANWIEGPTVIVESGREVATEIRYEGPDNSRRITVITFSRPFYPINVEGPTIHLSGPEIESRTAEHIQGSSQSYSFDDVPPGEYRVEIQDPRFLPWSQDGVRPGMSVKAHLKGSCVLVLEVVDASTREAISDYSPLLRFRNVTFSPREFPLLEEGASPPKDGVFEAIVPGDFTLVVKSQGRGTTEVEIDMLAPGERRMVRVELGRGGEIQGFLTRAEGEAVPQSEVSLTPHTDWSEAGDESGDPFELLQEVEARKLVAMTDADGRFVLAGIAPGLYDLSAGSAPFEAKDIVEVRSGVTTDVALSFPPSCFLAGEVLGPSGASYEGLRVSLNAAIDELDTRSLFVRLTPPIADLDSDGRFRLGPAAPGAYEVFLRLPDLVLGHMNQPGDQRALGSVQLAPGENTGVVFDAQAFFPGTLEIRVTFDSKPLAGVIVEMHPSTNQYSAGNGCFLGAEGTAVLRVMAGTYTVLVADPDGQWIAVPPGTLTVSPGALVPCELAITFHLGTLKILDASTGEPLADRPILLFPKLPGVEGFLPIRMISLQTDGAGDLTAQLPPGTYRVADGADLLVLLGKPEPPPEIVWTASGPVPAEIAIEIAAEGEYPVRIEDE